MNHIKKYALSFLIGWITFYTIGSMITYIPHVASQNIWWIESSITKIRQANPNERWFFWDIVAGIFLPSGKISTVFISAFRNIDHTNHNNTVPRWTKSNYNAEGEFRPGTIQDDGTNVGIWRSPTDSDTWPRLMVDGGIIANSAIVAQTFVAQKPTISTDPDSTLVTKWYLEGIIEELQEEIHWLRSWSRQDQGWNNYCIEVRNEDECIRALRNNGKPDSVMYYAAYHERYYTGPREGGDVWFTYVHPVSNRFYCYEDRITYSSPINTYLIDIFYDGSNDQYRIESLSDVHLCWK